MTNCDGTRIPDCLWFLAKDEEVDAKSGFRERRNLTDADFQKITSTYHRWWGDGRTRSHEAHEEGSGRKNSSLRAFFDELVCYRLSRWLNYETTCFAIALGAHHPMNCASSDFWTLPGEHPIVPQSLTTHASHGIVT